VGPNIKLKGVEITDCDTLVVEGMVEATMDSRLMQIAECGAFKGSACIDIAEIHGDFDGDLTVRDKLMIYATGKITGKVRYGKLVIEEGGQLSGEVIFGTVDDKVKPVERAARRTAGRLNPKRGQWPLIRFSRPCPGPCGRLRAGPRSPERRRSPESGCSAHGLPASCAHA
jgi:cytoskeletal protein CcmA (bactofilin family)